MTVIPRWLLSTSSALILAFHSAGQAALALPATVAHPAHGSGPTSTGTHPSFKPSTGINLNLSSTSATSTIRHHLSPINILVGGSTQTITSGQRVTAAERVAVYQVLHGGTQNIVVGANGAATGGSLVIGKYLSQQISNLVIPAGVTVIDKAATLNLSGNLRDSGTLYLLSSSPTATTASITAKNIFNYQTGLITTVLPTGSSLGLTSSANNLSLSLTAINNIVNSGAITSAANLSLTAGGSITNALPAGVAGPGPVMQAANQVNLTASNITNAGLIAATTGNINIAAPASGVLNQLAQTLNVNNAGGTFQALQGSINVGNALGSTNINLAGGNWLSQELNLNAGTVGGVTAHVDSISGEVNITGATADISNSSGNLNLSTLNLSGDPIITSAGDLTLASFNPTSQSDFVALAGGNISGDNITINTDGGQIFISAGYQFTGTNGDTCTTCVNGGTGSGHFSTNTSVVTNSNASVNLGSNSLLQTSALSGSGPVMIQATGDVTVGNILTAGAGGAANITGSGGAGGSAGGVTIQAGGNLSTGFVHAFGGGGGGSSLQSASYVGGAGGNGGLVSIISTNGSIAIAGDVNSSGGGGGGGAITAGVGGSASNITIIANGTLYIAGPVLAASGGSGGPAFGSGAGGGGSFGGGGGATQAGGSGSGGGGGYYGGGGGGGVGVSPAAIPALTGVGGQGAGGGGDGVSGLIFGSPGCSQCGGSGGGGGYSGGGGGGGGGVGGYGGGGGGGGGGLGQGGGGGGQGRGTGTVPPGGPGGDGGGGGASGSFGNAAIVVNGIGQTSGNGGNGGGGGGDGNGNGSQHSGNDDGTFNTYPNGGAFGVGGKTGTGPSGGTVNNYPGGNVTLSGQTVVVAGTIAGLGQSPGFSSSPFRNDSIYAGQTGTITISTSTSASSVYATNANYGSGVSTILAPTGGFYTAGSLDNGYVGIGPGTIIINGVTQVYGPGQGGSLAYVTANNNFVLPTGTYGGGTTATITEGSNHVVISPGSLVTPAEIVAFVQMNTTGQQPLILSQPASTTNPGTGYALRGTFNVGTQNIPAGNFTNLVLPAGVTETVNAPSITYTGSAMINGTMNFTSPVAQLNVGTTTNINGSVNFNGIATPIQIGFLTITPPTYGTILSGGSISGSGMVTASVALFLTTTSGSIGSSGNPITTQIGTSKATLGVNAGGSNSSVYISNLNPVTLISSSASSEFSLSNAGAVEIAGNLSVSGSYGGRIDLQASGTVTIDQEISVTADGTNAGGGGLIQFTSLSGNGPVSVVNNGTIQATDSSNSSGIIGFNGGPNGTVSLTGSGNVFGGGFVAFGNVNPTTLSTINGILVPSVSGFTNGSVTVSQSTSILNQIQVGLAPSAVTITPSTTAGGTPTTTFTTAFTLFTSAESSSSSSASEQTVVTDTQVAGDTPVNQNPSVNQQTSQQTPPGINNLISSIPTSPTQTFTAPGGSSSGWQQTSDPSGNVVWSCSGCVSSTGGGEPSTQHATRIFQRLANDVAGTENYPNDQANAVANSESPARSGRTGTAASPYTYLLASNPPAQTASSGDKDFDFVDLPKGMLLYSAKKPVVVKTQEGNVNIDRGAHAFVLETGHDVAIYNLHDRRTGNVTVVVNKSLVNIPPGKQLVLTRKQTADFAEINPGAKIAYRNPKPMDFGGGIKGFMADFSIPSAIYNLPPLRAMLTSTKRSDRDLVNQLLKNAAIMADVFGAAGPFKSSSN